MGATLEKPEKRGDTNFNVFKILVIGDKGSGKTSLINYFLDQNKDADLNADKENQTRDGFDILQTVDVRSKKISTNKNEVFLHLYDVSAEKKFVDHAKLNYTGSDVAILCFSLSNKPSLERVETYWISVLEERCKDIPLLLVGTRLDEREKAKKIDNFVDGSSARRVVQEHKLIEFYECSTETGHGVIEIFDKAVRSCLEKSVNIRRK